MDKKLAYIDITFENLDSIMIPADHVVCCCISDFSSKIICKERFVRRYTQAGYVRLELCKDVDNDAINYMNDNDPRKSMNEAIYKTLDKFQYREKLWEKIKIGQELLDKINNLNK